MSQGIRIAIIVVTILAAPQIASANAGVPMLALAWPAQWLAFIPIILLECELSRRSLCMNARQLIWPVTKANLISTLVGIPIAWGLMLIPTFGVAFSLSLFPTTVEVPKLIEYAMFPLTAAWVSGSSIWQVYFAFVILTVPFCIVSIWVEERVLRRSLPNQSHTLIHSAMVRANVFSYLMLAALALIYPIYK